MLRPSRFSMRSLDAVSATRGASVSHATASFSSPKTISLSVSTLKNCVRGFWKTLPTFSAIRYIGRSDMFSPFKNTSPRNSPSKNCGISPFRIRNPGERGLAAAAPAADQDALPVRDREIYIFKSPVRAVRIGKRDVSELNHCPTAFMTSSLTRNAAKIRIEI